MGERARGRDGRTEERTEGRREGEAQLSVPFCRQNQIKKRRRAARQLQHRLGGPQRRRRARRPPSGSPRPAVATARLGVLRRALRRRPRRLRPARRPWRQGHGVAARGSARRDAGRRRLALVDVTGGVTGM